MDLGRLKIDRTAMPPACSRPEEGEVRRNYNICPIKGGVLRSRTAFIKQEGNAIPAKYETDLSLCRNRAGNERKKAHF